MNASVKTLLLTTALLGQAAFCAAQAGPTPQANQTDPAAVTMDATSSDRAQDRWVSAAEVASDIDLARRAYADIHPGYTRFADRAALDAAWEAILTKSQASGGMETDDLYLAISEVLTLIRCDHTKAELPKALSDARKTDLVYLPLRWTIVENRGLILEAPETSALKAGDEILSIDGRSIAELQTALHPLIPVDGYNDHIKDSGMAASLEFMGGAVDHFGALMWDVPETAQVTVKRGNAEPETIDVPRVAYPTWRGIAIEASARNFKDAVTLERLGERSALLSVDTFVNYREPVDPHSLYGPVFEALAEEGRDQLILDLRKNGGGSSDAASALLAYFITAPRQQATAELFATLDHDPYVDYISTWNKRAINPPRLGFKKQEDGMYRLRDRWSDGVKKVKPAKTSFDGELIVLTSRSNSSGSTNLIGQLREVRNVTLIGETTGGNPTGPTAGTLFTLTLPESDIRLRVPVIRTVMNVTGLKDGYGLVPDISAPDTVESLRAGQDAAFDAALAYINQ